jgi:hypothetical protein
MIDRWEAQKWFALRGGSKGCDYASLSYYQTVRLMWKEIQPTNKLTELIYCHHEHAAA